MIQVTSVPQIKLDGSRFETSAFIYFVAQIANSQAQNLGEKKRHQTGHRISYVGSSDWHTGYI
jgi:hypothetical protein